MTQGYIFFGVDDQGSTQNIERAYALSISLKLADPDRDTCVVVHQFDQVPKRYEEGFDYIIELPFGRTEVNHHDFRIDWWQLYHATPFEKSLYIDTYSIAVDNLDSLWKIANGQDLIFGVANDYRGYKTRNNKQFLVQDRNNLTAFDAGMIYFEKDLESSEFFKMADPLFKDWRTVYLEVLPTKYRAPDFDFNLMINITAKMIGNPIVQEEMFDYTDLGINFLWTPDEDEEERWIDSLNVWFTRDCDLKINNHRQTGIVTYQDPDFLTKDMLTKLNDYYRKAKKTAQA